MDSAGADRFAMPESVGLDEGSWNELFDFLDPGRPQRTGPGRDDEALARHREITRRLVCFFAGRGCHEAEDLATETILRVAAKCREVDVSGYADRMGYFYGVARNVHHEWLRHALRESALRDALRRELTPASPLDLHTWPGKEAAHRCLDRCMATLTRRARQLIVRYYSAEPVARIAHHRELAVEFGYSPNALRIEVYRIRSTLRQCVDPCLRSGWAAAARGA
jgi:RNA polymerase sigma factor (sigma-70 family)